MRVLSIFIICIFLIACQSESQPESILEPQSEPEKSSQSIESAFLKPTLSLNIESLEDITVSNIANFMISGTCSEVGRPITVVVGEREEGVSPVTAPNCSNGAWTVTINLNALSRISRRIFITADHSALNGLSAPQARASVLLYPTLSINMDALQDITASNLTNFMVSGHCSEEGQSVMLRMGSLSPLREPYCFHGAWTTTMDLTGLSGASRRISVTADHWTSNGLAAHRVKGSVFLSPMVSIDMEPLEDIMTSNLTNFIVSGTCSEEGQPITVVVGEGESSVSPETAPICSSGVWTIALDLTGLSGASRVVSITANHSTSSGAAASPVIGSVFLYPRVSIDTESLKDIMASNIASFVMSGTCSEEGQPIMVVVGVGEGGVSPVTVPSCLQGAWTTTLDLTSLSGASRKISIAVDHSTLNDLVLTQATESVILYPSLSIDTESLEDITAFNITNFVVSGTCSEEGQPITLVVGEEGVNPVVEPATALHCFHGAWTTTLDLTSLRGASRVIPIMVDHLASSGLAALQVIENVLLYPTIFINTESLVDITAFNIAHFRVSGQCSEEGQAILLSVGGMTPSMAPTCTGGAWATTLNLTGLSGASRRISVTADHWISDGLAVTQATGSVLLHPTLSIDVESLTGITAANMAHFVVSGTCSEEGQSITVSVGVGEGGEEAEVNPVVSPATAPICTSGVWTTTLDLTGFSGASKKIFITADHSTSHGLATPHVTGSLLLYPRVSIDVGALKNITTVNAAHFVVSGLCSEEGRSITVTVGEGEGEVSPMVPATASSCFQGAWTTTLDLTGFSGSSRRVFIMADHTSSEGLKALQARQSVIFYLTFSIDTSSLVNISAANAAHFRVSGSCLSEGQPIIVTVGEEEDEVRQERVSPTTAPICTDGAWETHLDVTSLNKTLGMIFITADHSSLSGEVYPQATGSVENTFICPLNYVGVPALEGYTTNSFCVMKYEAKNDGSNNAVSQATGTPYVGINRNNSISKCTRLGEDYDLITNDEWQTLARNIELEPSNWATGVVGSSGGLSTGHSDGFPRTTLSADSDDDQGCSGTGEICNSSTWNKQRRTLTLSNGEVIWDAGGNVQEWVKDDNAIEYGENTKMSLVTRDSHMTLGSLSGGTTTTLRAAKDQFGPSGDYSNLDSSPYGGLGYGRLGHDFGGITRSQNYYGGSSAGVFSVNLLYFPTQAFRSVGFRCAYHPHAND